MDEKFLKAVQRFVANDSLPASTFRARGSKGTMKAAIDFMADFDLQTIPRSGSLVDFLDDETERLREALPPDWRPWGTARKALNIFLRSSLYSGYLREKYGLDEIEGKLETPVDSRIAMALHVRSSRKLPKWQAIKHLTKEQHQEYQVAAVEVARILKTYPVHLDLWFWRPNV